MASHYKGEHEDDDDEEEEEQDDDAEDAIAIVLIIVLMITRIVVIFDYKETIPTPIIEASGRSCVLHTGEESNIAARQRGRNHNMIQRVVE
ncbi:hypothetical protein LSAT2_008477 [Lamellibrachia satsuma]|nr:hypothetical protein LSAT2_008477 [Lamellibrachia satsuma]